MDRISPIGLAVPPFAPDPGAPALPVPAAAAADLPAVLAGLGIKVPGLQRRVIPGAPDIWAAPVEPGYTAASLWLRLRAAHPDTGYWPVFITSRGLEHVGDDGILGEQSMTAKISQQSVTPLSATRLLEHSYAEFVEYDQFPARDPGSWELHDAEGFDWEDIWVMVGDEYDQIALIRAGASWELPWLLRWPGACNYDIGSLDHLSMLRRWNARWGAELCGIGLQTLELAVHQPPRDEPGSLEAALESVLYCWDSQRESLDKLASLRSGPLWRLWWD